MPLPSNSPSVNDAFLQPLDGLVAASPHHRPALDYTDESWLRLGLQRVLEDVPSGRAFLQEHAPRFPDAATGRSNYFHANSSPHRLALLRDVNQALLARAAETLPDRLADLPGLARYGVFALDAHWHRAAAHDPRHEGKKMAVGHGYSLDLRRHTLRHLTVGQGVHEHDMSMLKRLKPAGLRHDVPKGTRVLLVHDRAGIDHDYWKRCRHERAVYFLSRVKDGMVFDWIASRLIDRADPRSRGVAEDREVMAPGGHKLRIIHYTDPATGTEYRFLTNEPDLSAGVLAELYRRRWDIEKVFDQVKNKLGEKKAWGTGDEAKTAQGQFVALAHNLALLYETRLETEHGVLNAAEDQRRARRQETLAETARAAGREATPFRLGVRRATQRSVKFLRWLRHALREHLAESAALPRLAALYASP